MGGFVGWVSQGVEGQGEFGVRSAPGTCAHARVALFVYRAGARPRARAAPRRPGAFALR